MTGMRSGTFATNLFGSVMTMAHDWMFLFSAFSGVPRFRTAAQAETPRPVRVDALKVREFPNDVLKRANRQYAAECLRIAQQTHDQR